MSSYFVRRQSKVLGPVSGQDIVDLAKAGKVHPTDEIATDKQGPWKPATSIGSLRAVFEASGLGPLPPPGKGSTSIVRTFTVKKNWRGKYVVSYKCPHCSSSLKSSERDLQGEEKCPDCRDSFRISEDAVTQIEDLRRQELEEKERLQKKMKAALQPPGLVLVCWKCQAKTLIANQCHSCGFEGSMMSAVWQLTAAKEGGKGWFCCRCETGWTSFECAECGQSNQAVNVRLTVWHDSDD